MSETASLPSYVGHPLPPSRTPTYTATPAAHEQRLALNERLPDPNNGGSFVKQSKSGGVSLHLEGQDSDALLPVYGNGAIVEGTVRVSKAENVSSVEIKIEGMLIMKEVAGSGSESHTLCLNRQVLWDRELLSGRCPQVLNFSLPLPQTFTDGRVDYPLPPTYDITLKGVPGFHAKIAYTIKIVVNKAKGTIFGLGNTTISTPFIYNPRTRPASPIPPPLQCFPGSRGFVDSPQWTCFNGRISSRPAAIHDITARLYLPRSRIFSLTQRIPFHLTFESSAVSLMQFLPYSPLPSLGMAGWPATRIQIVRQAICDVRNEMVMGTKTDLWTSDVIGEGLFHRADDGADWISFNGQVELTKPVAIGGFKAGGLLVKDNLVLTMLPNDPLKSPFRDLRLVVPIRLTTDPWTHDGDGDPYEGSAYSVPSEPEEYTESVPYLGQAF